MSKSTRKKPHSGIGLSHGDLGVVRDGRMGTIPHSVDQDAPKHNGKHMGSHTRRMKKDHGRETALAHSDPEDKHPGAYGAK